MPIEIRELVIKATVAPENFEDSGQTVNGSAGNPGFSSEEIINACVEKVMEILNEKNER